MSTRMPEDRTDPTLSPSFSLRNRIARFAWNMCWALLYRTSPRPCHAWRAMLLRLFGAQLGPACHFYPRSRIWAPWNLVCEDRVTVGDDAELYNPARFYLASHCIVSQGAYVCGATHEYNDPSFRLVSYPMTIGAYAWICARRPAQLDIAGLTEPPVRVPLARGIDRWAAHTDIGEVLLPHNHRVE